MGAYTDQTRRRFAEQHRLNQQRQQSSPSNETQSLQPEINQINQINQINNSLIDYFNQPITRVEPGPRLTTLPIRGGTRYIDYYYSAVDPAVAGASFESTFINSRPIPRGNGLIDQIPNRAPTSEQVPFNVSIKAITMLIEFVEKQLKDENLEERLRSRLEFRLANLEDTLFLIKRMQEEEVKKAKSKNK